MKSYKNILAIIILFGVIAAPFNSVLAAATAAANSGTDAAGAGAAAATAVTAQSTTMATIIAADTVAGAELTACLARETAGGAASGVGAAANTLIAPGTVETCIILGAPILAVLEEVALNTALTNTLNATKDVRDVEKEILNFVWRMAHLVLKNLILDRLVDSLINWISGGGKGAIIDDWGAFFEDVKQGAVGYAAQQLGKGYLCQPFNLQVNLSLVNPSKFSQQITCTLDKIVNNIDSFMENFENGGWLGYQEMWQPRNNYYGAVLLGMNEISLEQDKQIEAAKNEAISNQGFIGKKICDKFGLNCKITTPGSLIKESYKVATLDIPVGRLISASDLDNYMTAILNASINRIAKSGLEGIKSLYGKKTSDFTGGASASSPCTGLTGEAYTACLNSESAGNKVFKNYQQSLGGFVTAAIDTRKQISDSLNETIALQTNYVDKLSNLVTCTSDQAKIKELAEEQAVLDYLQEKVEGNQMVMDNLTNSEEGISGVGYPDWSGIEKVIYTGSSDGIAEAANEQATINTELNEITLNITNKLPAVETALQSCPTTTR